MGEAKEQNNKRPKGKGAELARSFGSYRDMIKREQYDEMSQVQF
jgi:hypothetical protein